MRLTVTDDGHGPAAPGAVGSPSRTTGGTGGTGLKGLAERLGAAGGTLDGGPDGRRGFRVVAELPAEPDQDAGQPPGTATAAATAGTERTTR